MGARARKLGVVPRALAQSWPVYLDDRLLVLRTSVADVVYVWSRVGSTDPPDVDFEDEDAYASAGGGATLPAGSAALEAAIQAREQGKAGPGGRPINRQIIPKYN